MFITKAESGNKWEPNSTEKLENIIEEPRLKKMHSILIWQQNISHVVKANYKKSAVSINMEEKKIMVYVEQNYYVYQEMRKRLKKIIDKIKFIDFGEKPIQSFTTLKI